jgi:glycolate dehydrogenase FAD-linked subunit
MSLPPGVLHALQDAVGSAHVVTDPALLAVWERDGSIARGLPDVVVLPATTAEVQAVVGIAARHGLPLVARGAGSGLSGGAVTVCGGISLQTTRMRRILRIDPSRRWALVEPGVANGDLNAQAERQGLFYAPDPSSRRTCTIGGNAAENAGGARSIRYGVTGQHVLGAEVVLADGTVHWLGGESAERSGFDLLDLLIGSEGTLGVITRIQTRLVPLPEVSATIASAFDSVAAANGCVSEVLARGVDPAALEVMDATTAAAVEARFRIGCPAGAGAVLITELHSSLSAAGEQLAETASAVRVSGGAEVAVATEPGEAERIWEARRGAIAALAGIGPNFYLHDMAAPRSQLPELIALAAEIGRDCAVPVASVFHAGDGSLHPTLLYDARERRALEAVVAAGEAMLLACVAAGGTLTGEHGIGVEKSDLLSALNGPNEIRSMVGVKRAFDPAGILNPGKIFPSPAAGARPEPRAGTTQDAQWW